MVYRSIAGLLRGLRGQDETLGAPPRAAPLIPASARGDSKRRHLSAIDIFCDLGPEDLEWLTAHTTMVTARRGQLVYLPGETREALFLLKAGRVQTYRLAPDGKKVILSVVEPETFFGDMPLAGQQMHGAFAEVVEASSICVLGRGDLDQLIRRRPEVAIRLLEVTGRRLLEAEAIIENFAFKSVPSRLATVLLRLTAERADAVVGYSHQELAEMVGTYRETATLALDDFKRRGLVDLGRRHVRLLDRAGLEQVAQS